MSSYLRDLRGLVGHRYVLVPCVAILIEDGDGRILLMRSSDDGLWQTVGGAVDPDESPRDAAVREVREEAGVEIDLGDVVAVLGGPAYRITYANGDLVGVVSTVFRARIREGEPTADGDEALELAWWTREALAQCPVNSFTRALLVDVGILGD